MPIATLTIEAEDTLIHAAEGVAAQNHTTLSELVVEYLQLLTVQRGSQPAAGLPPLTAAASGLLKKLPDRPYRELIEEAINAKHGLS